MALVISIKNLAFMLLRLFLLMLINPIILWNGKIIFILRLVWIIFYIHTRQALILIGFPSPRSFNGLLFFNVVVLTLFILVLVLCIFCFQTIHVITVWHYLRRFHPLKLLPFFILLRISIEIIVSGYICVSWLREVSHVLDMWVFYAFALANFSKWQI